MQSIWHGLSTTYMLDNITVIRANYGDILLLFSFSRELPASQPETMVLFSQKFYMLGGSNSTDPFNCYIKCILNISHHTSRVELG